MCKADMIHCAPRLSDSMNDSLCQSEPDKDWVLREGPTWEPSALSQSSLPAGRLIWDKVMVMCLLQRDLTGQSAPPSAFRTTAIRVASFFLFETFNNNNTPLSLPWLNAAKLHYIYCANKVLLLLFKNQPSRRTEQKDPRDWEECKAANGLLSRVLSDGQVGEIASRLYCPVPRNSNVNESQRFSRLFQRKKRGLCWGVHKGKQKQSNCPQSGRWVDGQLVSQATSRKWRPERTSRKEMLPSQCWEMCNLALLGLCVPQND